VARSTKSIDDLKALLKPYDPALMEAYAVNRAVTRNFGHCQSRRWLDAVRG
jgi:hypothetical protein